MKNSIVDLRNHLFEVIERLKDPRAADPMDCETAEAICLVAKRLIETAEVEIKFRDMIGNHKDPSEFLRLPGAKPVEANCTLGPESATRVPELQSGSPDS